MTSLEEKMARKKIKLNIGCGVGLLSGFINVDKFLELPDLLKAEGVYANAKVPKDAEFIQADICNLPFVDDYADYILCVDVIEHLRMRDVVTGFKELHRVLKPKGRMLLMTTNFDDLIDCWNELKKEKFDVDKYLEVVEIMFGNQAGFSEGELHKSAFNADYLNLSLQTAGFNKYTLSGYPRGSAHPGLDGYFKETEGRSLRSSMFVVEATK